MNRLQVELNTMIIPNEGYTMNLPHNAKVGMHSIHHESSNTGGAYQGYLKIATSTTNALPLGVITENNTG